MCEKTPGCVAFNSNGWLKSSVVDPNQIVVSQGTDLYIKREPTQPKVGGSVKEGNKKSMQYGGTLLLLLLALFGFWWWRRSQSQSNKNK